MTNISSKKATVVLGITSGIAAYKMLDFIPLLQKENLDVQVVMTQSATHMIHQGEIENLTGKKVFTNLFEEGFSYQDILQKRTVDHIALADRADIIVVAPATANVIAKLAHGIADDFLTTMVLASNSPIVLSPSMNVYMWNNPVTQENIAQLKRRGFVILPPEKGPLACGYEGKGRLPHLEKIRDEVMRQLMRGSSLKGKTVLITAGATLEKLDDVRFITNKSSGKMGAAIADAAHLRGANVILLRAKNAVETRYAIQQDTFETYEELETLVRTYVKKTDIMIHTAAIGDFIVKESRSGKTKSDAAFSVNLFPQKKLSNEIKVLNKDVFLVVFKAEWGSDEQSLVRLAKTKMKESDADMIVANDISKNDRGFGTDDNEGIVLLKKGAFKKIPLTTKDRMAEKILDVLSGINE